MHREQILAFYVTVLCDTGNERHVPSTHGELWGQQAPGSPQELISPGKYPKQGEQRASDLLLCRQEALNTNNRFNLSSSLNKQGKKAALGALGSFCGWTRSVEQFIYAHLWSGCKSQLFVPSAWQRRTTLGGARQKTRVHVVITGFKWTREKYGHARHCSQVPSRLICCRYVHGTLHEAFLLLYQVLDLVKFQTILNSGGKRTNKKPTQIFSNNIQHTP